MSSEEATKWELSKENIQPLKQGRKVAALSVAMDENEAKALALTRQEFETEIRTYSGDDPLDIWYRYALWTEQSFPKGGKGSKLYKLIESCVMAFQFDGHSLEKYANDLRFLELWVKYASMCPKPLEVYQTMDAKGLCTELAQFYENWAWEYEKMNNLKKADAVYMKGLQNGAQPSDELQLAHKNFQVRAVRMAIEDNQSEDNFESNEPQRGAFNTLKGVGNKKRAPHERAGPGAVLGSVGKFQVSDASEKNAPSFQIYSDENGTPLSSCNVKSGSVPIGPRTNRENEKQAGKWAKQKLSQRTTGVVPVTDVDKYNRPAFEVHQDENGGSATPKPSSTNDVLTAHSKQSGTWHVPLFVPEPFDPKRQPQYPKHKVYCGTEEFSLEELRAANYFKKIKEREVLMADVKASVMDEFMEMKRELEKHKELIMKMAGKGNKNQNTSQQDVSRQLYQDSWIAVNKSINNSQMFEDMKPNNPSITPAVQMLEDMKSNTSDKVNEISFGKTNSGSGSVRSANSSQNVGASPTVNTKQAMCMIKDLWNGSLFNTTTNNSSGNDELMKQRDGGSFVFKDSSKETQPGAIGGGGFTVYEDEPTGPQQQPQPQIPFIIHSDVHDTAPSQAPFPIFSDDKPANDGISDLNDQYQDDHNENQPPPDYVVQPKRTVTGILQPSKDIKFIPLEEQKKLEEDMLEEDEVLAEPLAEPLAKPLIETEKTMFGAKIEDQSMFGNIPADMTLKVPGSSEAFALNARVASTPAPWSTIDVVPQAESCGNDFTLSILSGKRSHCFMSDQDLMEDVKNLKDSPEKKEEEELSGELMPPPHSEAPEKPLSPIMECSREYRSSSSSSGSSTLGCHWTSHQKTAGGYSMSHMSRSRHLLSMQSEGELRYETVNETNAMPIEDLSKSGYMADKSGGESLSRSRQPLVPELKPVEEVTFNPAMMASLLMSKDEMMLDLQDYGEPSESRNESQSSTQKAPNAKGSKAMQMSVEELDPFDEELCDNLLHNLDVPINQRGGFMELKGNVPVVKSDIQLSLGPEIFQVKRQCGEGAYAQVFLAVTLDSMNVTVLPMDVDTDDGDDIMQVVLKVEKPACHWEFYICHELRQRLKAQKRPEHILDSVLRMNRGYFFSNGSIMVNPYHKHGSLLNAINVYRKTGSLMPEELVLYFTIEMLAILETIHSCNIIHADIKPDNFILASRPEINIPASTPEEMFSNCPQSLKLIDFGRSIDMNLFPKGTTFTKKVTTESFTCCEMQDGRPWTYQTDLYCVAATAHCMLRGNYMTVVKDEDRNIWKLKDGVFKRYWLRQLWGEFFHTILNIQSCSDIPAAGDLKRKFMKAFHENQKHKEFAFKVGSLLTNLNKGK
ncbi:uncharacterized protein LOC143033920 [Oratosquilla oratoria]|uniref:uncharacterized protein LOC143033920 n=1 Tax=Oratosquilla oratoria TaxID=337810 RepID=UPI003F7728B1